MDKDSYQDDKHDTPDGVYPISLGENARNRLKCVINWDISEIEPIRVCSINIILEEAREYPDSDLGKLYTNIQMCKLDEIFVVYDKFRQYGSEFLICLTDQAKYTFKCIEENKNMGLVNRSKDYVYQPPTPRKWENFGSEKEIEQDWVGDTRPKICILVKRSKRRYVNREFEDRDVNDATDGYVGCDAYNDTIKWGSVHSMERGMQAVPVLVDNSAQTELKYPKNTYCQYESRVFSEEQIKEHMESDEMKQFMNKVSNIINEIQKDPDIMGRFRNDITKFYKRDEVEHVEQTEMIEIMAFSDLTFTNKMKVNHIRWHPIIEGIVAMSVMDDNNFSDYLKTSSERTIVPNFLTYLE
ncbi:dynein axonemal intermediate chain 3-like [Lepeophtheirus salmonis]|uniref:dynein axonemal intermediate chain 3-like n=1 Tax=Lepeophtheirus salmonis TaxID=72036 RepID=UPI001AE37CAA|nr:dynein intermediate chain 3, axonemal-like [Lepeophtheirus salmonis]